MRCWALSLCLLVAACSGDPHRAVRKQAQDLATKGELSSALTLLENYLTQHPEAQSVRQEEFFVLLKAEQLDPALKLIANQPQRATWLTDALRHADPTVRASAAHLACEGPVPVPLNLLRRRLEDSAPDVRRYSVRALGFRRDQGALKQIFRALHDPAWIVRAEAAEAMMRVGNPRAAGWLIAALNDGDGFVRYHIFEALHALACKENQALFQAALNRVNPAQNFGVAIGLAKLGDASAFPVLRQAVTSPDQDVRRRAAVALGECGLEAAEKPLRVLARDDDRAVRQAALTALSRFQSPPATGKKQGE